MLKKRRISEKELKNRVVDYIRRRYPNAWIYKTADIWQSGIPDLLICIYGRLYAIELKAGKNKPTRIQSHVLCNIFKAGARVQVCRSLIEVKDFFDRWEVKDGE